MNLKSIIGRAVRLKEGTIRLTGAAWGDGTALDRVDIKVDDGPWKAARLEKKPKSKFTWTFFSYDWKNAEPGEHTVVSRVLGVDGRVQPSPEDPAIKLKQTYWESNAQHPWQIHIQ